MDPYPKEPQLKKKKYQLPTQFDESVYFDRDYKQENSPKLKYIPSAEVMIQIMRACCNAKTVQQLWFNERKISRLRIRYTAALEAKLSLQYQVAKQLSQLGF